MKIRSDEYRINKEQDDQLLRENADYQSDTKLRRMEERISELGEAFADIAKARNKFYAEWKKELEENARLTKRCEEARKIVEWNNDAAAYFVAKKKWEEGKP